MLSFLEWFDKKGFFIADTYDPIENTWKQGGRMSLFDHQRDILGYCLTPNVNGQFPFTTLIYSAPKKSGKTAIGAAIGEYAAESFPDGTEIYTLANDEFQSAERVYKDMAYHVKHAGIAKPLKGKIAYPNDTTVQVIAKEYKSAAGSRHAMTLWDELWGYDDERARRLWAEMTPIPTVPYSLRIVVTYAGFEGVGLLWDLYEQVVLKGEPVPELAHIKDAMGNPVCWRKGRMFAYWDTEPRMPWQTPAYYEEQRVDMRPSDYLRLHENQWVTTHETFMPIEWWDDAAKAFDVPLLLQEDSPYRYWPVVVAVDVGTKSDGCGVVGVMYDYKRKKCILAFHRYWQPTSDDPIDLEETVEKYLIEMYTKFKIVDITYDPSQFHRSMTTLKKLGMPMTEFSQQGKMIGATQTLFDVMREKRLEAYPDKDMRDHLLWAVAEQKSSGFRLVKESHKSRHKIDLAVCLAMAIYRAIETGGVDLRNPIRLELPWAEGSNMRTKTKDELMEEKLPEELRSEKEWVMF